MNARLSHHDQFSGGIDLHLVDPNNSRFVTADHSSRLYVAVIRPIEHQNCAFLLGLFGSWSLTSEITVQSYCDDVVDRIHSNRLSSSQLRVRTFDDSNGRSIAVGFARIDQDA